jgi:hypothetical protein
MDAARLVLTYCVIVEKDRVTLLCAPRLSWSVLSLLQFILLVHKENVRFLMRRNCKL